MKVLAIAVLLFLTGIVGAAETTPKLSPGVQVWKDIADGMIPAFYNGNQLFQEAREDRAGFLSYVAGVHDSLKADGSFCGPPRITLGQVGDVVIKYLSNNPENRDNQAQILVRFALAEAWPCSGAK